MAPDNKSAGPSPALVEFMAGLSAGAATAFTCHQLDMIKTRMQVYRKDGNAVVKNATSSSSVLQTVALRRGSSSPTVRGVFRELLASEKPLAALYRGITISMIGNSTSWASFFFLKSRAETLLLSRKNKASASASPSVQLSQADYFVASLAAGMGTQLLTNPIWVLKTRMVASDRTAEGAYRSTWDGAKLMWQKEGIRGCYAGLVMGLVSTSHGAVQFSVYDPLKRMVLARQENSSSSGGGGPGSVVVVEDNTKLSTEMTLLLSTLSKIAANVVSYPLHTVRSRLQTHNASELYGRGIVDVCRRLYREAGLRGFYRGMGPGVFRLLPATWVTFLVYENVRFYLPLWMA